MVRAAVPAEIMRQFAEPNLPDIIEENAWGADEVSLSLPTSQSGPKNLPVFPLNSTTRSQNPAPTSQATSVEWVTPS